MFGIAWWVGSEKGSHGASLPGPDPVGWDRICHGSRTRTLLACSGGPSAAGDGRIGDAGTERAHREQWTVSHCAGTGSMATPAQTRSSARPCAPPPRPLPPRLRFRWVLRRLLPGHGAPLLRSPLGQHGRGLHDRQRLLAARASGHLAPTANRRPGPAPPPLSANGECAEAAVGSFRLGSERVLQAGLVELRLNNPRGRALMGVVWKKGRRVDPESPGFLVIPQKLLSV